MLLKDDTIKYSKTEILCILQEMAAVLVSLHNTIQEDLPNQTPPGSVEPEFSDEDLIFCAKCDQQMQRKYIGDHSCIELLKNLLNTFEEVSRADTNCINAWADRFTKQKEISRLAETVCEKAYKLSYRPMNIYVESDDVQEALKAWHESKVDVDEREGA